MGRQFRQRAHQPPRSSQNSLQPPVDTASRFTRRSSFTSWRNAFNSAASVLVVPAAHRHRPRPASPTSATTRHRRRAAPRPASPIPASRRSPRAAGTPCAPHALQLLRVPPLTALRLHLSIHGSRPHSKVESLRGSQGGSGSAATCAQRGKGEKHDHRRSEPSQHPDHLSEAREPTCTTPRAGRIRLPQPRIELP